MDAFSKLMNLGHQVRGKVFNMDNKLEWINSLLTMKMYDVELKEESQIILFLFYIVLNQKISKLLLWLV